MNQRILQSRRSFLRRGLFVAGVTACLSPTFFAHATQAFWPGMQHEIYDWLRRIKINAGSPGSSATLLSAMKNNAFLVRVKRDGIRPYLKRVNTCSGGIDLNNSLTPLIADVGDAMDTQLGGSGFTYSEAVGWTSPGSRYLQTGVLLASAPFGDNDLHIGVYVRTGSNEASVCAGIQQTSIPSDVALMPSNGGTSYWDSNNATTGRISASDSLGKGFYLGVRSSSSSSVLYKAGTSIASTTNAGGARPTGCAGGLTVFGINDASLCNASGTTRVLAGYTVGLGSGLDATKSEAYSNHWQYLQSIHSARHV